MATPEGLRGDEAFMEHHEAPFYPDQEKARRIVDLINSLSTNLPDGGMLSTLVLNTRNNYLGIPVDTYTAEQVQILCEGFLTEIESLRLQIVAQQVDEIQA